MARIDDESICQLRQHPLQYSLGLIDVQMLDGLVEKYERSVAEQSAGEIQPLRFAERQHVLADPRIEPSRKTAVEFHGG